MTSTPRFSSPIIISCSSSSLLLSISMMTILLLVVSFTDYSPSHHNTVQAANWFSFNNNKPSSDNDEKEQQQDKDKQHLADHRNSARNNHQGGGGGGGYFRRVNRFQQEQEDQQQQENNDENNQRILFNENENESQEDSTAAIGIGSTTSSVLGPHTGKDEVATQRRIDKERSAPAKLLREYENKGAHHPCWKKAVLRLRSLCEDVLADKLKRTRLALEFMACQLELDGKDPSHARCENDEDSEGIASCASKLPETLYPIKVQFDHHVDTLCFHLQEELLHERTKQIVDRLGVASTQAARNLAELSFRSGQIDQSMQALHGSQKLATASAETLATALRSVNEIGVDIKKAFEDDKIGIELVSEKLQSLLDTHEIMQKSNQALARSMQTLSDDHIKAVSTLGVEVDSTRRKLLAGMEGLTSLQTKTSRFIGSIDAAIHYVFVFMVIWVVTTAARTQDARFAALMTGPVSSILAERYLLRGFLKMFSLFGLCTNPDLILEAHEYRFSQMRNGEDIGGNIFNDHINADGDAAASNTNNNNNDFAGSGNKANLILDPTPLRNFFIFVAFVVIVTYAYFYQSPEQRQFKMIAELVNRAASNHRSNNDSSFSSSSAGKPSFNPRLVSMERHDDENNNHDTSSTSAGTDNSAKKKRGSSGKK